MFNYYRYYSQENTCQKYFQDNNYFESAICYKDLYDKSNIIRYKFNETISYLRIGDIDKTLIGINYILDNEKNDKSIIDKSEQLFDEINKYYKIDGKTLNYSTGDYTADVKGRRWQVPRHIKYYIYAHPKKNLIQKAVNMWDDDLGQIVDFIPCDSPNNANIIFVFTKEVLSNDKTRLGQTFYYYDKNKDYMIKAQVKISEIDHTINDKISDSQILHVALHEIGHALGVSGHSKSSGDVMFSTTKIYKTIEDVKLSKRDINTVKRIYSK